MPTLLARWLGIDITTTEMALAVADDRGNEGFAAVKMRGATRLNGDPAYPAFDLSFVSGMLLELLRSLQEQGWQFDQTGSLSVACRQHDLAVLDRERRPLLPALSWQCNAASNETRELNSQPEVVASVGQVEARFILPKLRHLLKKEPSLAARIGQITTTGDWVLGMLSGETRLSTSDALSNGLLVQETRELAREAFQRAELDPRWLPEVVQSGHAIGEVLSGNKLDKNWEQICRQLSGWQVVAGLGDNHASALGCGMRNEKTLVVSAGTSGTINLACSVDTELESPADGAARFEFYRRHRLLLRMLPYCGDWYNRFLEEFGGDLRDAHGLLNDLARQAELAGVWRVECTADGERYRPGWTRLSLSRKVASIQFSIAAELLVHVKKILMEVPQSATHIERYVLTGGLSRSPLFQQAFHAGIQKLVGDRSIKISGRRGPLRYKTSAYGALLNARLPEWKQNLSNMPDSCFPLSACEEADDRAKAQLQRMLADDLD